MTTLGTLLAQEQARRNVSDRAVSRATGVSPTTIGRIKQGYAVDWATLEKICNWLGVSPSTVMDADAFSRVPEAEGPASADQLAVQLRAILEARPDLYDLFKQLVGEIAAGKRSPDVLVEAIKYANFKIHIEEDQ